MIDPLEEVLDQIQAGMPPNADVEYLIYRLGATNEVDSTGDLFRRSFGYFMAKKVGNQQHYEAAITAFTRQIDTQVANDKTPDWLIQFLYNPASHRIS